MRTAIESSQVTRHAVQAAYSIPSPNPVATFGGGVTSVALSANGKEALLGDQGAGAAYLFAESGGAWSASPVATFTAPGGPGGYGFSVALSGDGQTALIGCNGGDTAYVYTAASGWSNTPATLVETGQSGDYGHDVALSSDGQTALVGDTGEAYMFTDSVSGWSASLTFPAPLGGSSLYGVEVALSADGNTALIGDPYANDLDGAAYLYTAPYIVPPADAPEPAATFTGVHGAESYFGGTAVSLSADGNTVLVGAYAANAVAGAAYLYVNSGSAWSDTPTATFTDADGPDPIELGWSATLSGDGQSALIGDFPQTPFVSYLYTAATGWSNTPAASYEGGTGEGPSVALSSDGETVLTSGNPSTYVYGGVRAAPVFTSSPSVTDTFGTAFSMTITAAGDPAPKLTKSGTLPPGVTFTAGSDGTATLAGTPDNSALGNYPITFTAKNSVGSASQDFTLTVAKPPAISKIPATTAQVGDPLDLTITASGYTTPTLAESGTLPAGLSFTDNGNGTATIAGTPQAGSGGAYRPMITATNQLGTATTSFTLKVDEAPAITSADNAAATIGKAFSFPVTATGYPAPKITESGTLPSGVTFKAATATLSGRPAAGTAGSYPITFTATSASGTTMQGFTLTVSPASLPLRGHYLMP